MDFSQSSQSSQSFSSEEEEDPCTSQHMLVPQILRRVFIDDKTAKLVEFLLLKYQKKELVTKAEMLHIVDHNYHEHFPLIFKRVCECMCFGFGIDVRQGNSPSHTYDLVPVLGLTYKGIIGGDQIIPKIDLLIVILTVIFVKGNCVSEEDIGKVLRMRTMLPKRKNFLNEVRWKFVTEDLVQEQYLEYRQVPNSDPARYEFLWGPRAKAETSKMKVLEHLAKVNKIHPRSCPILFEQALREELKASVN
ncbi:melanoma-associated antigen 10-like isoform X1 [Fukomys damarensis]|uniref:melanoma-associated antigen 10-like isoform X1 n=1 Tax=Fukomys damarensis TaxID=885580 RepID=UPI00054016F3|nr:melanoma-associated antigen 10-like isoform X1 [Fukomys damarensis]XP_010621414.1 melanoma-associated antigen 10-like isoform X1 [Fukomys damarensis]XP_010621417.1 melanoma-associated antigen 10-like isoform X1 [Fukomys damarensis]XP_010621418.1 melanoma-associated antigen 10-like isoform X1 [Fukomys damarensis]XP_010621419.1 melanoma-associated antigen 10-like isoform X1 [Fukomys damarensis]XP_010621420.1 melanoma-associated antigen 10-like isoform X1 [Fukomys damarensis]